MKETPERSNWKSKQLDLPIFNGENSDGWIFQAERYFHFHKLTEEEIMESAMVSLAGDALQFQSEHQQPFMSSG